jgi:hypothetical protein
MWTGDVRDFDHTTILRPGFIWASPVCTMYSRARTNTKPPLDLEGADSLVAAALRIQAACVAPYSSRIPRRAPSKRDRSCRAYPS